MTVLAITLAAYALFTIKELAAPCVIDTTTAPTDETFSVVIR